MKSGKLVPDAIVTEMVAGAAGSPDGNYLLDGFPRNIEQAHGLDEMLKRRRRPVDP